LAFWARRELWANKWWHAWSGTDGFGQRGWQQASARPGSVTGIAVEAGFANAGESSFLTVETIKPGSGPQLIFRRWIRQ